MADQSHVCHTGTSIQGQTAAASCLARLAEEEGHLLAEHMPAVQVTAWGMHACWSLLA